MNILLLFGVLALTSSSLCAMNREQEIGLNYGEENVFLGSTQVNDTPVFFGMEKIETDRDEQNWSNYQRHALAVAGLYKYLNESIIGGKPLSLENLKLNNKLKNMTWFSSEDEFQQYLPRFKEFVQDKKSINIATSIDIGAHGFFQLLQTGNYVIYASKQKVSGKYPFPENLRSMSPLLALETYFSDLIMVVCSRDYRLHHNADITSFENRGIFKNPVNSFYDGNTFSGLSLKLHGFVAYARKNLIPDESNAMKGKDYMYVGSAYGMTMALVRCREWKEGDFILNGKDFVTCTEEEKKPGYGDTPCFIKIDALIRLYQN